jgi:hypothetical protein
VTWVLLVPIGGRHLTYMAFSPGPERSIRLFPYRLPWPRRVFASSVVLHVLGLALAGWTTQGTHRTLISASPEHMTRAHAIHYLVLTRPPTRPEPQPERRPPSPPGPVASVRASATPPGGMNVVNSASQRVRRSALQTEELPPGTVVGMGQIIPTPHSDSTGGRGLAGMLGFRMPTTGIRPAKRGLDRVAELVGRTGSACPELRTPAAWTKREFAVALAFVVDTNGAVDPATLRVIESPGRPQTEHRVYSHIYVVGATVRVDARRINPAVYDSVLIQDVASHVAGLVFRPALREGRAIRSNVLVSCQTS